MCYIPMHMCAHFSGSLFTTMSSPCTTPTSPINIIKGVRTCVESFLLLFCFSFSISFILAACNHRALCCIYRQHILYILKRARGSVFCVFFFSVCCLFALFYYLMMLLQRVEDDVGSKGKEGKSGCRNPDALASFNAHLRSIRNSGVS